MQACGRLTDIEFFGHRHEVAQVTSFHGHDTYPVSSCHQIDIIQALFCDSSFATEMKNKPALEIDRRANVRAPSEKLNFTKHLVGFWQDLEDNQRNSRVLDQGHCPLNASIVMMHPKRLKTGEVL